MDGFAVLRVKRGNPPKHLCSHFPPQQVPAVTLLVLFSRLLKRSVILLDHRFRGTLTWPRLIKRLSLTIKWWLDCCLEACWKQIKKLNKTEICRPFKLPKKEDDIKRDSSSLVWFIQVNMCYISLSCYLILYITSCLQSPTLVLLIGYQISPRWRLKLDDYHVNSKSRLGEASKEVVRKYAPNPAMIGPKWYWYLSLLVSSCLAGSGTVKTQSACGCPRRRWNLLKAHDEKWLATLSVCSWFWPDITQGRAYSSACCSQRGALQQQPLKKKKRRATTGKSIHPNVITKVSPHFITKMNSDEVERARVKFWNACYKSVGLFTFSIK